MSLNATRLRALIVMAAATSVLIVVPATATLATEPAPTASPAPIASPLATEPTVTISQPAASIVAAVSLSTQTVGSAGVLPAPPARPARPRTVAASIVIVALAKTHLGARYRWGSTGPFAFDCSGLVWRVFRQARLGRDVTSQSAIWIYRDYLRRGLASRTNPQVGDLVVWGYGSHIGIYIGHGLAISALIEGVRVHRVNAVLTPFTTYLHTGVNRIALPIRLLPRGVRPA